MNTQSWAPNQTTQKGFTIVELLIVIVVIAILAAITVVAYNGITNNAYDATVKADLATVVKQLEMRKVSLERYPSAPTADWQTTTFKFTKNAYRTGAGINNAMYCLGTATDTYVLVAQSRSGKYFMAKNGSVQDVATLGAYNIADYACQQAAGVNWVGGAGTSSVHGYNGSGNPTYYTDGWYNSWPWSAA